MPATSTSPNKPLQQGNLTQSQTQPSSSQPNTVSKDPARTPATIWARRSSAPSGSSQKQTPSASAASRGAATSQAKRFRPKIITRDDGDLEYQQQNYQPVVGYIAQNTNGPRRHWNVIPTHRWQPGTGGQQSMYAYTATGSYAPTATAERLGKKQITSSLEFDYLRDLFDYYHAHVMAHLNDEREERRAQVSKSRHAQPARSQAQSQPGPYRSDAMPQLESNNQHGGEGYAHQASRSQSGDWQRSYHSHGHGGHQERQRGYVEPRAQPAAAVQHKSSATPSRPSGHSAPQSEGYRGYGGHSSRSQTQSGSQQSGTSRGDVIYLTGGSRENATVLYRKQRGDGDARSDKSDPPPYPHHLFASGQADQTGITGRSPRSSSRHSQPQAAPVAAPPLPSHQTPQTWRQTQTGEPYRQRDAAVHHQDGYHQSDSYYEGRSSNATRQNRDPASHNQPGGRDRGNVYVAPSQRVPEAREQSYMTTQQDVPVAQDYRHAHVDKQRAASSVAYSYPDRPVTQDARYSHPDRLVTQDTRYHRGDEQLRKSHTASGAGSWDTRVVAMVPTPYDSRRHAPDSSSYQQPSKSVTWAGGQGQSVANRPTSHTIVSQREHPQSKRDDRMAVRRPTAMQVAQGKPTILHPGRSQNTQSSSSSSSAGQFCANCHSQAKLKCSVCQVVWYCSRECQVRPQ